MKKNGRQVAGAIPITEERKIVLITNKKGNFILPKGGVKRRESPWEAAQREAKEEAGIIGNISTKEYGKIKEISYYVLNVMSLMDIFDESKTRTRIVQSKEELYANSLVPKKIKNLLENFFKEY